MNDNGLYSPEWFKKQKMGSSTSAEIIVPIVMDFISPKSVVDVGCGVGTWLESFTKKGVNDVLGIDGSWIDESQLRIPKKLFKMTDISKPFATGRKADLAISLEVGEHLADSSAQGLVKSLTDTAPVVLFSAAIPSQPGTGHVNGQWPEYWAAHFKKYGYMPIDCIRRRVWTNPNVEYWYAQNAIMYVRESGLSAYPKLVREAECGYSQPLPLVHPRRYYYALQPLPSIPFRAVRKVKHLARKLMPKSARKRQA